MSFEPPRETTESRGIPGMVIPLAFVSVLLLAAVLVFGALAFDFQLPGMGDDEPEYANPAETVQMSGFVVRERSVQDATTIVEAELSVINTGDQPVDAFQIMVQCDDNGYVSTIADTGGLEAGEDRTIAIRMDGRGEPACHEPIVEFSDMRPGA